MWKGTQFSPTKMDIDPQFNLDVVANFYDMPFSDKSFDVIVFDPPHLPVASASENSSGIWRDTYGLTNSGAGREGDNISGMFLGFAKEAKRVLKPGGIVLAKIADLVHNHRYQWQQVDFVNAIRQVEMTPCDMMIKCDPCAGNLKSSKWKNVKHLRKSHCYWIVVRNSKKCEG
jgi:SAM-dependent methyltransferase